MQMRQPNFVESPTLLRDQAMRLASPGSRAAKPRLTPLGPRSTPNKGSTDRELNAMWERIETLGKAMGRAKQQGRMQEFEALLVQLEALFPKAKAAIEAYCRRPGLPPREQDRCSRALQGVDGDSVPSMERWIRNARAFVNESKLPPPDSTAMGYASQLASLRKNIVELVEYITNCRTQGKPCDHLSYQLVGFVKNYEAYLAQLHLRCKQRPFRGCHELMERDVVEFPAAVLRKLSKVVPDWELLWRKEINRNSARPRSEKTTSSSRRVPAMSSVKPGASGVMTLAPTQPPPQAPPSLLPNAPPSPKGNDEEKKSGSLLPLLLVAAGAYLLLNQ